MFDQSKADAICDRLAEGESLRSICKSEGMPSRTEVFRWLFDDANQAFRDQYARARELQADTLFDEIPDIADDGSNDWMERELEGGLIVEVVNHEHISRSKLRIEARKWLAGKLRPKKYGDSTMIKHADADGEKLGLAEALAARRAQVVEGRDGDEA